jgi:small subunit ribosomal protein MRP21
MDLMKARETMMRSSQSLMAFREPARRVAFVSRHCRAQPLNASTSRSFATSMRRQQDDDSSNAASAVKSAPAHPDSPARRSVSDDISNILNSAMDGTKGTPTAPSARTSRFASRNAQSTSSPARAQLTAEQQQQQARGSIDDLMAQFKAPQTRNASRNVADSLNPRGNRSGPPPVPQPAPMKLGPTLGRTVYVDNQRGFDVARAFRTMDIQIGRNQVRKEFARQKFHERPGKKRKRLHSERWRKRFKIGFKATVKRVLKMRKQGW